MGLGVWGLPQGQNYGEHGKRVRNAWQGYLCQNSGCSLDGDMLKENVGTLEKVWVVVYRMDHVYADRKCIEQKY